MRPSRRQNGPSRVREKPAQGSRDKKSNDSKADGRWKRNRDKLNSKKEEKPKPQESGNGWWQRNREKYWQNESDGNFAESSEKSDSRPGRGKNKNDGNSSRRRNNNGKASEDKIR